MSIKAELKENILASKLESTLKWVLKYRFQALLVVGILVGALLVGSVFVFRQKEQGERSWTRLAQAQGLFEQKQLAPAKAILEELITQNPTNPIGFFSSYYIGQINLTEKEYENAVTRFTFVVEQSENLPLKPLALSSLAHTYEKLQKFSEASEIYQTFMLEHDDHFMAPRIQLALGRTLVQAGDVSSAKESLTQLIDLYPTSKWAENARRILDKIETR